MRLWSSKDAAETLGVSAQRVRALARAGKLEARKVGSRWVVEPALGKREPRSGRPMSPAIAWAILAELSGARPDWVHPSALSRLRRRLRDPEWVLLSLQHSQPRARVVRWRALPADLPRIIKRAAIVPTGLSAISEEIDLVASSGEIDAYVDRNMLGVIEKQFRPAKESEEPNLTLRVPRLPWILSFSLAPLAVVSADLLLSPDQRVSRAGREALRKLIHD
jgi:hypothetical protein